MADILTGTVPVTTREQVREEYLKSYVIRQPEAETGPKTQPYVDASVYADGAMLLLSGVQPLADGTNVLTARGEALDRHGEELGVVRPPATPSTGFVNITTIAGGSTIFEGDELLHRPTNQVFRCRVEATYTSSTPVPIESVDTGPATNLAPGTVLEWTNPRPGCATKATVTEQSEGRGLAGGRDEATDDEYLQIILFRKANPPASGNDAEIQDEVFKVDGLAVQAVWTFPAIKGPGTTAVVFTVFPDTATSSRIPTESQMQLVEEHLRAVFPGDFSIFVAELMEQDVEIVLEIEWRTTAAGWADVAPWPSYLASDLVRVTGLGPSASQARVSTGTTTTNPQVGQTIAFFNATTGSFARKRISAITTHTSGEDWTLTFDLTNDASDTSYVPYVGQACSPWSEALPNLVAPVRSWFQVNGPGEMVASLPDPGVRQRRQPAVPDYPNQITNRLLLPVFAVAGVKDADLLEPTVPYNTTVGTPPVLAYLQVLSDLVVFAP